MLWVTRGRSWGHRFLRDGGFEDPLPEFEEVFSSADDSSDVFLRAGDKVAVRFLDPEGRRDAAGRVIRHEFVLFPPLSGDLVSLDEARLAVWPTVADEYARLYGD